MKTPKAPKYDTILEKFGDQRLDSYYWLKDKDNPEVIKYLNSENRYTNAVLKNTQAFQKELFKEMKARYKKDDESIPYFFNQYWYIVKEVAKKEYPIFYRKFQSLDQPEELLLDVNLLAEDQDYTDVCSLAVSPNNHLASYAVDGLGDLVYTVYFKDLQTGDLLSDVLPNTTGKLVWAADSQHVFYVTKDKSLRADKVFRHKLGTAVSDDVLVFHEQDETFDVTIQKSKSQEFIFIFSSSTLSDETQYIYADQPESDWKMIQKRSLGLEYNVDYFDGEFYIITNSDGATNFKLMKTSVGQPGIENWVEIIAHREEVLLEGFELFKHHMVLEERSKGLAQIRIINKLNQEDYYLPFSDATYTAHLGLNLEFDTNELQYVYTSLTKPAATFLFNMDAKTQTLLKKQVITGGKFDEANYISERIMVPSRDGKVEVPVSLVYHKNTQKTAETPLLLYGYGSYGMTIDATFSRIRLSLLDRGFIYAIAHIRGGEYLGRNWYDDGKMLHKKNSFYDFIDCARFLVTHQYTSSAHLYAMGGSAGGLLVGAVMNMDPNLFNGVVAQVPFVDVVTTMLDETIPLTTGEYDEWGNPNDQTYYEYMKSYSPYDNVEAKDYPNVLVTTGLNDGQVQYWEPAKWVAKLRELKTDSNLLLFNIEMKSGHGGASGRYEGLKEDALEYTFLLMLEGKMEVSSSLISKFAVRKNIVNNDRDRIVG